MKRNIIKILFTAGGLFVGSMLVAQGAMTTDQPNLPAGKLSGGPNYNAPQSQGHQAVTGSRGSTNMKPGTTGKTGHTGMRSRSGMTGSTGMRGPSGAKPSTGQPGPQR